MRLRTVPLERYRDFKKVGQGGMGIVYWALDTELNRSVAFKVVRPDAGSEDPAVTAAAAPLALAPPQADTPASQAFATLKARFLQEAWVTGGMEHPGIVPVYEVGETPEGVPYYTMRFVKGTRTLAQAIEEARTKPMEERLALLEPFLKVCDAVRYAHARGVIHRDLKPDNVALGEFGEVVVLDWGLAKVKGDPEGPADPWAKRLEEYRQAADLRTVAGALGTPGYMAPEALKGQTNEVDERSDVYSLGAILFQLLTGRLPFTFATWVELAIKVLREDAPTVASIDAAVPAALSDLCARCLAREKAERPADAAALAHALRAWQAQSAADREAERVLEQARTALAAAKDLQGAERLKQIDRAALAAQRVLDHRSDSADARALLAEVEGLRETGTRERESAARRRLLRRGGVGVLAAAVVTAVLVGRAIDARREEAERAQARAESALAEARVLGLAGASEMTSESEPILSLLLAREAVRRALPGPVPAAAQTRLHAALSTTLLRWKHEPHPDNLSTSAILSPDGTRIALSEMLHGEPHAVQGVRLLDVRGRVVARIPDQDAAHLVFSDDGARLLAIPRAATEPLRVYTRDGKPLTSFLRPEGPVATARFLASDGTLLTYNTDGSADLRRPDGTVRAHVLIPAREGKGGRSMRWEEEYIACLVPVPGAARVVAVTKSQPARLLDWDGREVAVLKEGVEGVTVALPAPDGSVIATGGTDGRLRLWDMEGRRITTFAATPMGAPAIEGLRGSPDGRWWIAWSPSDKGGEAWRWDRSAPEEDPDSVGEGASDGAVLSDGTVVLATAKGVVRYSPDETVTELTREPGGILTRLSPSHPFFACGELGEQSTERLIDRRGRVVGSLTGGWEFAADHSFDARGRWLLRQDVIGSGDIGLYATESGEGPIGVQDSDLYNPDVAASPAGDLWAVYEQAEGDTVVLWDGTAAAPRWLPGRGLRFSPKGDRLLIRDDDGLVLTSPAGAEIARRKGDVLDACFVGDGQRVAFISEWASGPKQGGRAELWDPRTGEVRVLDAGEGAFVPTNVLCSPSGDWILAYDIEAVEGLRSNGAACVWDSEGRRIARFSGPQMKPQRDGSGASEFVAIRFLPDVGRIVALARSGQGEQRVVLGDGRGGWDAPLSSAVDIAGIWVDPLGRRIVGSTDDRRAFVWTSDGRLAATLEGHSSQVTDVAFSPRGDLVATCAFEDRATRLWTGDGTLVAVLAGHAQGVRSCGFDASGRRLLTWSVDGTLRVWFAQPEDLLALADDRLTRDFTPAERRRYAALLGHEGDDAPR